jgi:hypothetical protein
VRREQLEPMLGGLNGREPFLEYILRRARVLQESGVGRAQLLIAVEAEIRFWRRLLQAQMQQYDEMRSATNGVRRGYVFVHYEFDDLFRYCDDPVATFGIDLGMELDQQHVGPLVRQFEAFIRRRRSRLPITEYPLSPVSFFRKTYVSLAAAAVQLGFAAVLPFARARRAYWTAVFRRTPSDHCADAVRGKRFWVNTILFAALMSIVVVAAAVGVGIRLATHAPGGAQEVLAYGLHLLIVAMFIPIWVRAFCQIGRVSTAFRHGWRSGVATVRTWSQFIDRFWSVWPSLTQRECRFYREMVDEMSRDHLITRDEHERLTAGQCAIPPRNDRARERMRRWLNVSHLMYSARGSVPAVSSWQDVRSVTALVFSVNELFRYSWLELAAPDQDGGRRLEPILTTLTGKYPDEWSYLLAELRCLLNADELECLARRCWSVVPGNHEALARIEYWANIRLQTLFTTLEGCRKLFVVYEALARHCFPELDENECKARVRQKVQVILLHDWYPRYAPTSPQKREIDRYFEQHRDLELRWSNDLVHASKSGAWATVLPFIRGEFLLTLDADHRAAIEELHRLPNVLAEFSRDPDLDVISFRLQTFNEEYSLVARCGALAEDSWYLQDLRAKHLVGGGGAYGKMIYRVSSVGPKELVQPDSVGEDMLTMARLQAENSGIRFVEYFQIEQGQEVSYCGLKRKYGRYPIGAIESSLCRPFKEMLLSDRTPWHRKADALFMVSYFPIQILVVLANFVILFAFAFSLIRFDTNSSTVLLMVAFSVLLADSLMAYTNLWERYGFLSGTLVFLRFLIPMGVLHVSFIPHYFEQFVRGLRGHARFNHSMKRSEYVESTWREAFSEHRFTFVVGSVQLSLACLGLARASDFGWKVAVIAPFVFNSVVWTIGPLVFIPRPTLRAKILDVLFGLPYIIVRSYYFLIQSSLARSAKCVAAVLRCSVAVNVVGSPGRDA